MPTARREGPPFWPGLGPLPELLSSDQTREQTLAPVCQALLSPAGEGAYPGPEHEPLLTPAAAPGPLPSTSSSCGVLAPSMAALSNVERSCVSSLVLPTGQEAAPQLGSGHSLLIPGPYTPASVGSRPFLRHLLSPTLPQAESPSPRNQIPWQEFTACWSEGDLRNYLVQAGHGGTYL